MIRTLFLQTPPKEGETTAVLDALITDEMPTDDQIRVWLFGDQAVTAFRPPPQDVEGDEAESDEAEGEEAESDEAEGEEAESAKAALPEIDRSRLIALEGDEAAQPIGFGWTYDGKKFHAPPPLPRVVSGADFLALFTPAEVAALWTADPRLQAGAMRVMAQNSANLSSPEARDLMLLAVAKGVMTKERADKVLAGVAP